MMFKSFELQQLYNALYSKAKAGLLAMLIVTNTKVLRSMQSMPLPALAARALQTQRHAYNQM